MGCGTSNPRTSVSRSSIRNLKSKQTRDFDSVSNEVDLKKQIKPSSISLVVEKSDIVIPESAQIQENIATRQLKDSIDGLEPEAISKVGLSSSSFDSVQNNPDIHYFDGVHQGLQLLCRDEFFSKYTKEKMYKWRPAEIIDVDPLDRSQVVIHYIGWASSFDIRLDLKEDFKNVALIDVVPPLQAEKGYPLDDVQTTITVNYLFTGVLNKNKNAVKRVLSRSQSKSINISSEPYINIDTSRSLITRSKDQTHEVGSVTSSITNSTIRSAPYVPGEMVDILDIFYKRGADTPTRKWRRADILAVNGDEIVIHYINWDSKFDETLNIRKNADRIAPPGSMTNLASMNGHTTRINGTFSNHTTPRFKNRDLPQQASELDNINSSSNGVMRRDGSRKNGISQKNNYHDGKNGYYISAADQQLAEEEAEIDRQFIQILEDRGLHVIEIVGDGNCLFRAISHQLYLNEHKHLELREKCVNHMLEHKKRFEVFCYDENFDDHIKSMKLPGTWADDLEIRALEEILDRLICIYSPESIGNNGEEPIKKNFEEDILLKSVETINLSYHGNNHYNSIYDERYKLPLSLRDTNIILSSRLKLFEQNINSSLQKNERVQSGRNNDEFDKKE